jgi:hypothetical protein
MARRKQKTVFIAMTYRGWSRAPTAEKAVAILKADYGAAALKAYGYTVYEVAPGTAVDCLGYSIIYPKGSTPKHVKTVEGAIRGLTKQVKPATGRTHQQQIMEVGSDVAH